MKNWQIQIEPDILKDVWFNSCPCGLKAPMTWVRFSSATKWYNWATIKYDKNDNNEETSKNNSSGLKKGKFNLREI